MFENCHHANKLSNNVEIDYYNAKIHYDNNNNKKALDILKNYLTNIPPKNNFCVDKMVSTKIYELLILILSKLGEKYQGIDLINWLIRKQMNMRNQFIILSAFLSNFECTKKYGVDEIDNYKLTYSGSEKHMLFNQKIVKFITHSNKLILHLKTQY